MCKIQLTDMHKTLWTKLCIKYNELLCISVVYKVVYEIDDYNYKRCFT